MRKEHFTNALRMLRSQLREEEESYETALNDKKLFSQLNRIKQRMKSLQELLFAMESKQENLISKGPNTVIQYNGF